jgi:hypothetical protein
MSVGVQFLDRFAKKVKRDNGKTALEFSSIPVAYKEAEGDFKGILTEFSQSETAFYCMENVLKTTILKDPREDFNVIIEDDEGHQIEIDLRRLVLNRGDRQEILCVVDESKNYLTHNENGSDSVVFQLEAFPGFLDEYISENGKLKHNMYLLDPISDWNIEGNFLEVVHMVRVSSDFKLRTMSGLRSKEFITTGDIAIVFPESELECVIKRPTFSDVNGRRLPVCYKVSPINNRGFMLSYVLIGGTSNIEYPLIVDPTFEMQTSRSVTSRTDYIRDHIEFSQDVIWYAAAYGQYQSCQSNGTGYAAIIDHNGVTQGSCYRGSNGQSTAGPKAVYITKTGGSTAPYHRISRGGGGYGGAFSRIEWEETDVIPPIVSLSSYSREWSVDDVSVTITASDEGSGVETLEYSWSTTTTPGVWFPTTSGATLTQSSDGAWYLHYRAVDGSGNVTSGYEGLYRIDKTPPTASISINNNAMFTQATSVSLGVTANDSLSGVSQMRFSNDNNTWSSWEPFKHTKTWTLPPGESKKTVYVEVRDVAGNSIVVNGDIYVFSSIFVSPKMVGSLANSQPRLMMNTPYWGSAIYPHIQVDTTTAFNSGFLVEANASTSSAGWISLGSGYPADSTVMHDLQTSLTNKRWYMRVRYRIAGQWSNWSEATSFTVNAPLWHNIIADEVAPASGHLEQLRTVTNSVREARGLPRYSWTDPSLQGKPLRKVYIDELRSAVNSVAVAISKPSPSWVDPTIIAGTTKCRAIHFIQIKNELEKL